MHLSKDRPEPSDQLEDCRRSGESSFYANNVPFYLVDVNNVFSALGRCFANHGSPWSAATSQARLDDSAMGHQGALLDSYTKSEFEGRGMV